MADPGFLPGFIGVGIDMAITQILHHVGIAVSCKRQLESLRDLVTRIEPMVTQIHQYRLELNKNRGTSTGGSHINIWVLSLQKLLQQALEIVPKCASIRRCDAISRYQTSRRITSLISEIEKHLEIAPLVLLQQQQTQMLRESAQASTSTSANTSEGLAPTTGGFLIQEPLIVGQEKAFTELEMWLIDADVKPLFRMGVLGKGGSGKTLLLKRLFSSQKVRHFFGDAFFLWLTVSQSPLFKNLRHELCSQISMQTKEQLVENMREEDAKNWLNQRMKGKRFALFLDDVWGEGGQLLEELGVALLTDHSNYKIIASSRDRRALLDMGVPENSTIAVGDLVEEKSWDLFVHHAFPYNNGKLPANVDEMTAKLVCAKCGGLPLAIKVIGRSMAGIMDAQEWELWLALDISYCSNVWVTRGKKWEGKRMASIADLSTLTQLKVLRVQNNGESNIEGTFASMVEMEILNLQATMMTDLPEDIFKMSKLRTITLECSRVVKMESKFCEFQNLIHLKLAGCHVLEELPNLHELRSLKQLDIIKCSKLKKFPKGFSETGAFPSLEIFLLVSLEELEELSLLEEGAMPVLKIFTLMLCESLEILPQSYLNLKTLQKIRVYGCSMVLENLHRIKIVDTQVEVITMSTTDTLEIVKKHKQVISALEGWMYGEFWCNQLWLFLHEIGPILH